MASGRRLVACVRCGKVRQCAGRGMCPPCYQTTWRNEHPEAKEKKLEWDKQRLKDRRKTPEGAAKFAWNRLIARSGAKYGHRQCYATVEVRMTKDEFLTWAVSEYERWFAEQPGVTPSVDRKDATGHYELGNLQLIPVEENRQKNSRRRMHEAPPGMWWCPLCERYLPVDQFYKISRPSSPKRIYGSRCKKCSIAETAERRRQRRAAGLPR